MAAELLHVAPPMRGSSEFFCSNPRCRFHVRAGDPGVEGFGDWARLADGTTTSHRWADGDLLCDLCARRRVRQQPKR